jgi:hypothetical protein
MSELAWQALSIAGWWKEVIGCLTNLPCGWVVQVGGALGKEAPLALLGAVGDPAAGRRPLVAVLSQRKEGRAFTTQVRAPDGWWVGPAGEGWGEDRLAMRPGRVAQLSRADQCLLLGCAHMHYNRLPLLVPRAHAAFRRALSTCRRSVNCGQPACSLAVKGANNVGHGG